MFFYALTSAELQGWCLEVFSVSENDVLSLLLHKVIFKLSLVNIGKMLRKVHCCITFNGAQKHEGFVDFKNARSRANTFTKLGSLLCTLLLMALIFVITLECVCVRSNSCASTGLQIYGVGLGHCPMISKYGQSLSKAMGPLDPFFLVVNKSHFDKNIHRTASL